MKPTPPFNSVTQLRVATNEAEVGRAALVADNHTEFRTNGFRTGAKDSSEESDRTVGVTIPAGDIPPAEVTAIALRVKASSSGSGDGLSDQRGEHVGMEDNGIFVFRREVRGVRDVPCALGCASIGGIRIATDPSSTDEIVAGSHGVYQVVETSVATFDAEGLNQFARFRPTEILTDVRVELDEVVRSLGGGDEQEHGSTVFFAVCILTSAVTNQPGVEVPQDSLGQPARRQIGGAERTFGLAGSRQEFGLVSIDVVVSETNVFVTVTVFPSILSVLSHHRHDVAELFLTTNGEP